MESFKTKGTKYKCSQLKNKKDRERNKKKSPGCNDEVHVGSDPPIKS